MAGYYGILQYPPNFYNFMKLHRETLKAIEVNQGRILKIVENFPNLKIVRIYNLKVLENIRMPQVEEVEADHCEGSYLASSFPNVKKLNCQRDSDLVFYIKNCQNLEEVEYSGFDDFRPFTVPKSLKKFKLFYASPWRINKNYPYALPFNNFKSNNVEEIELYNSSDIQWVADFLHNLEGRKVKICLQKLKIPFRVQKAFEIHQKKIEKLKIIDCTYETKAEHDAKKNEPESDGEMDFEDEDGFELYNELFNNFCDEYLNIF